MSSSNKIGDGSFGAAVYNFGSDHVVKILDKQRLQNQFGNLHEIEKMYRIEGKINCLYYGLGSAVFKKTADKFYIFMLKVPGVAINKIACDEKYKDLRPKMLFALRNGYLASTLAGIHNLGISHGDFKWDNVFYEPTSDKFFPIDFGLSGIITDSKLRSDFTYLENIIISVNSALKTNIDIIRAKNPVSVNKNKVNYDFTKITTHLSNRRIVLY
ncbi:hypothetical protein QEJ31_03235 [Pigmentibacter sp. JX0631]|uniref:OspG family effector kinase n=1 Tax=Pigmentibacter sp. JX0631 TaxID=2976982 RepID=UPI0024694139|nr:hypothetical protein [Pigmentibacter sp. JX0631]WGL60615.1 hypothetical protein QEJ31_03235 [Pigmentibacter sp. JX0631]